jgi:Glycosyl hydrolase family 9
LYTVFDSKREHYACVCCQMSKAFFGGRAHPLAPCRCNRYNSTSYYDDMTWAATWMYQATRQATYLNDAIQYYVLHSQVLLAQESCLQLGWGSRNTSGLAGHACCRFGVHSWFTGVSENPELCRWT